MGDSVRKNAENEIDKKTKSYMRRHGVDYRTACYMVVEGDTELRDRYNYGSDAVVAKVYDGDTLAPAQREMTILLADTGKTQMRAGWAMDTLAQRKLANVGGITDPLDAYRRALSEVRKENPSLAMAAESGFIDSKDFPLLAMLVPAVAGEIQKGRYNRFESAPDVRVYRDDLPVAKITALEIFAAGTWNNDVYRAEDLDAMVDAFDKVGFQPTVKAGHADGQEDEREARRVFGSPALGYVERIYRVGSKLLADIKDVPRRFAELIKAGAYRRVSSEIYWQYSKNGKQFPRVLKAISFLGADVPAITDLKAVELLYQRNGHFVECDNDGSEPRIY